MELYTEEGSMLNIPEDLGADELGELLRAIAKRLDEQTGNFGVDDSMNVLNAATQLRWTAGVIENYAL